MAEDLTDRNAPATAPGHAPANRATADRGWRYAWWLRAAFAVTILALPALTLWNATVAAANPRLFVKIGPGIGGLNVPDPVPLSLDAIADGKFQRAVAHAIAGAMPTRPGLVRLNNDIAYTVFDKVNNTAVTRGDDGYLFERHYVEEYCGRTADDARRLAEVAIPKLRELQAYYRERGAVFLYVLTPGKMSQVPQYVTGRVHCPSTADARARLVPDYVAHVRAAGIDVLDFITATTRLSADYHMPMFTKGGAHWNALASAHAAQAIAERIDAETGRETIRPFRFTFVMSGRLPPLDRDLEDAMTLLYGRMKDVSPHIIYDPAGGGCETSPARTLNAAIVAGSFMHPIAEALIGPGCAEKLKLYFYFYRSTFGGMPYDVTKTDLGDADFAALRDARVMIVEENELMIGRSRHLDLFWRTLTGRERGPMPGLKDLPHFISPPRQVSAQAGTANATGMN